MTRIRGTFEVKLTPQPVLDAAEPGAGPGRLTIDKRFEGELSATSTGQMLSVRTETAGSAGYVALEQVVGSLSGKSGSFFLQHSGIMDRGAPSLSVTVVPDSGTGELLGLRGKMEIEITDGRHFYVFEYAL